jgi:hypothetical protein
MANLDEGEKPNLADDRVFVYILHSTGIANFP